MSSSDLAESFGLADEAAGRSVKPDLASHPGQRCVGSGGQIWVEHVLPRLLASVGAWFTAQISAGCFRPYPLPVLAQLLIGPITLHLLFRPALASHFGPAHPDLDDAVDAFTDGFLAAVSATP